MNQYVVFTDTLLDDETVVLSEFIVDMGAALGALAARGTAIELTVIGRAGGAVCAR